MQADLGLETIPSYVNISSSVLRNKFEQNRARTLQKLAESVNESEIINANVVNIEKLNNAVVENFIKTEEKFNNIQRESKSIEDRLTSSIKDAQLRNEKMMETLSNKMKELEGSIANSKLTLEKTTESLSNKIKDLDTSTGTSKITLEKTTETLSNKIKALELSITDIKYRFDTFSNDQILLTSGISEECLNKVNSLASFIDETQTKLNAISNENAMEEKITALTSSVSDVKTIFNEFSVKMEKIDQFEEFKLFVINSLLPKDFNWQIYRDLNYDLIDLDEMELKRHYLSYGRKENRMYIIAENALPKDFNWLEYIQMNIDIAKYLKTEKSTMSQYLKDGVLDKRLYKMSQLEDVTFFVYSGRKSGSSTLNYSFLNLNNTLSIQIHNNEDFLFKYGQTNFTSIFELVENNMKKHKQIFIVDSYRTPIEKKISSFFEDIDTYIPNYRECDISYLITYFNKKYIYGKNCSHVYTEDYEPLDEMLEHFKLPGIKKFDFDKKYTLIKHKNLVFLKLRFNEIKIWESLISTVIGKSFVLMDKNISSDKNYNDVYEKFKSQYKIPKEFLEKLKSDVRFNTYNSKTEQIKYIKDWSAKSC